MIYVYILVAVKLQHYLIRDNLLQNYRKSYNFFWKVYKFLDLQNDPIKLKFLVIVAVHCDNVCQLIKIDPQRSSPVNSVAVNKYQWQKSPPVVISQHPTLIGLLVMYVLLIFSRKTEEYFLIVQWIIRQTPSAVCGSRHSRLPSLSKRFWWLNWLI